MAAHSERFSGNVALVTGGSRGIGLACAMELAQGGAFVMISSRKKEGLKAAADNIADSIGSMDRVSWTVAHAGDPQQANACVNATIEKFGRIDMLINNAATNPHFGPLLSIEQSQAQKTIEVNQLGILAWCKAAVDAGLNKGEAGGSGAGSIINIASIGGLAPEPGIGMYNATKAAVVHMTRQLAYELAPAIRVNAVAPGLVKTDMARALWETQEDEIASHVPMRRLGEPIDIARAVAFLCSADASWITGEILVVDGGTTIQPTGGVGPALS